jgi:hypothetical protein
MAARASARFNRIVFMSISKFRILIVMTGSAKLTLSFDQVKGILRSVRCMTDKAAVI